MPPWEELETHIPRLYRFALRLTSDADLAEDFTQDTLLKAWQKRKQLRELNAVRVWLFQILVNLWRDHLRRNQHRPASAGIDSAIDPGPLPEDVAASRDEMLQVLKAVEKLPPRQREVLHLSAVEELNTSQIAEVLGITANSVKVSLSLARKAMRQAFPVHNPQASTTKLK